MGTVSGLNGGHVLVVMSPTFGICCHLGKMSMCGLISEHECSIESELLALLVSMPDKYCRHALPMSDLGV